jgi:hypothetical protein
MDSFNTPVDFARLAIINDDVVPVLAYTGSCSRSALAAADASSNLVPSPSSLASGSREGG